MRSWRIGFKRGAIGRASLSSLVATACDYAAFATLVSLGSVAALATLLGCLLGGVVNFTINRNWTFHGRGPLGHAMLRYAVVSGASAVANAALVALATVGLGVTARPAWMFARALVFVSITYPLFRSWAFVTEPALPRRERPRKELDSRLALASVFRRFSFQPSELECSSYAASSDDI